jgi:hypothetical protein
VSLLAGALLCTVIGFAGAATDDLLQSLDEWGEPVPVAFNFKNDVWEVGLDAGYSFALGPRKIDQSVRDNFIDLVNDPVLISFLKPYQYETLEGDLHNAFASNAHIFRRVSPLISGGLELGYEYNNINWPLPPIYSEPDVVIPDISWHMDILQITPAIKIGPSQGHWRPYVTLGAGMALVHESFFLDNGPISEGTGPMRDWNVSGDRRDLYLTTTATLGMEFALPYNWSVGINTRYSQIFAPNPQGGLMFVIPSAHCDYHF